MKKDYGNLIKVGKNKFKCKNCKNEVSDLKFSETGEIIYNVFLDLKGNIQYEQDEIYGNGDCVFFCPECGEDLVYDEETAKRILKQQTKNERR